MDKNCSKKDVVERSKSHKGKKKLDASTSKSRRAKALRKVKAKNLPVSPSSDDIDEDYAEFLKTYVPKEFYAYGSPPGEEEGSQIIVESAAKMPKSSKMKSSK
ncbi:hypothetical protein QL285_071829 [Trifolium repens]|nr:hypothetical protein QL285_071829 [Trifolium repens]